MKSRITPFFIFILFINIFSFQGHAQKSIQQDIDKIKQFIPQKLDSALILSKGLLKYTSKKSDSLLAISHYFQGIIYYYKGHYYISSEYYLRALKSAFVENNKKFKGKIHNNLGVNYDMTDQYEMALTEYKKSMEIDQEFNDFEGIAQSNLNIGLLYFNLKQYDNGLKYINEALEYFKKEEYHQGLGLCYHNMGLLYLDKKNYDEALDYLLMANSEYFASGDPYERGVNLLNLVICANEMGYTQDALQFLAESKALAEQNDFEYLLDLNLLAEAEFNISSGQHHKAKNILKGIAPSNIRTTKKKNILEFKIELLSDQSKNKAEIIDNYIDQLDSLENYKISQIILDIQNQYKSEIDGLSTQIIRSKKEKQNLLYLLITISGILLVLLFLILISKKNNRKNIDPQI